MSTTPQRSATPRKPLESQLTPCLAARSSTVLRTPARVVDIAFSDGFDFAGCVNVTHRSPNQFSYRYGRLVHPKQ